MHIDIGGDRRGGDSTMLDGNLSLSLRRGRVL